ncbi:Cysteine proteinase inhibitor 8, partial [Cucurbita argyrosperma subsp. sororia]
MSSIEAASIQNNARLQDSDDIHYGGWVAIMDINDPYVQELGRFAVMEHAMQSKEDVTFTKVVSGATQVVAGKAYRLVIKGVSNSEKMFSYFEAVVLDIPWEHSWKLLSFKPRPIV